MAVCLISGGEVGLYAGGCNPVRPDEGFHDGFRTCLSPLRDPSTGERPGRALPALPAAERSHGRTACGAGRRGGRLRCHPLRQPASAPPSGILSAVDETFGPVPRVLLRDGPADGERPALPCSEDMPASAGDEGRYQLLGEIARGGMGIVLKGRDVDVGRDVAVKVLLEKHRDNPEMVRRFVEEAQIAGQLQHPGIVPVYELGRLPDARLYIAMKLIRGRTLAALLDDRADTGEDRPKYLAVFEQMCQTMAYAHACGVIHRDLKPSNVMVGSFGEVQVMDWGLAKVLGRGGVADEERSLRSRADVEPVRTLRTGSSADESRAGSVLGTPCYMAPEQARGLLDTLDERADVFGLGAILCEILTGAAALYGAERQRGLRQGGTGGPGRGPGPARRLRRARPSWSRWRSPASRWLRGTGRGTPAWSPAP